jgi:hypothetical protein
MTANGSMALWCERRPGADSATMEAHFNYWRIAGDNDFRGTKKRKVRDFLEVGVMLMGAISVEKILIYLPHVLDSQDVEDCCPYFNQTAIVQGIFNEVLTSTVSGSTGPANIELRLESGIYCRVHRFMESRGVIDSSHLEVIREAEGTLLTISRRAIEEVCDRLPDGAKVYFRARIYLPMRDGQRNRFVHTISTRGRFLQSEFNEVEYVDFRVNEARTLPRKIEEMMRDGEKSGKIPINRIAFLAAVPVVSELSVSSAGWHKSRLLEHQIWNTYVPDGIPPSMMVYHWRKCSDSGIADFGAFVKLQTRRSGRKILATYLITAFLFGVSGNLVAAGIQPCLVSAWSWMTDLFSHSGKAESLDAQRWPPTRAEKVLGSQL